MGSEFLRNGVSFPSLEVLSFEVMWGWEVWSTNGRSTTRVVKDAVFPCLKELHIECCPSLVEFSFKGDKVFPFLQELCIKGWSNLLEVSLEALPSLRVLTIARCGDGVLGSVVRVALSVGVLNIRSISGITNEYHPQTHIPLRPNLGVLQIGIKSQGYRELDIVMSDSEDSTVTYTEAPPSPDYVPGPEEPEQAPPSPEFVPEPVYLEFMPPEDEVFPTEEKPLPAV
ncbi:NBS-LRR resistance-like protein, partial [Tanacetum coccineum]